MTSLTDHDTLRSKHFIFTLVLCHFSTLLFFSMIKLVYFNINIFE